MPGRGKEGRKWYMDREKMSGVGKPSHSKRKRGRKNYNEKQNVPKLIKKY